MSTNLAIKSNQDLSPATKQAQEQTVISVIEKIASNPEMDVGKAERLIEMQMRLLKQQSKDSFNRAMSAFQSECPSIKKTRSIGNRGTYASLDDIIRVIQPYLNKHGLSFSFDTKYEQGFITATCTIRHVEGHSISSTFTAPIDSKMSANETQKAGSANTYSKRYALQNALGIITTDSDDDGNAAGTAFLSPKQVEQIKRLIKDTDTDLKTFLDYYKAESIEEMNPNYFRTAIQALKAKKDRNNAN